MKTSSNLASLVLAGALGLPACGGGRSSSGGPDSPETRRGYLTTGGELYAFEACGTTNLIWADLIGSSPSGAELLPSFALSCVPTDGGTAPSLCTVYVELEGTIASGGSYGHAGKFSQQLTVNRTLVASPTGPADCPFLEPVYPF